MIQRIFDKQGYIGKTARTNMIKTILLTHRILRMREETLFLSVYLIDKYMSEQEIKTKDINLLVLTTLFIAAKYEETTYVKLYKIIEASQLRLEPACVIQFEAEMLATFDFKLNIICPYDFLKRIFLVQKVDDKNFSKIKSRLLFICFGSESFFG